MKVRRKSEIAEAVEKIVTHELIMLRKVATVNTIAKQITDKIMNELAAHYEPVPEPPARPLEDWLSNKDSLLTVHILRNWERDKMRRFAQHLLGDTPTPSVSESIPLTAMLPPMVTSMKYTMRKVKRAKAKMESLRGENNGVL